MIPRRASPVQAAVDAGRASPYSRGRFSGPPSGRAGACESASVGIERESGWFRRFRKAVAFAGMQFGMRIAKSGSGPGAVESLRGALRIAIRLAWPLRRRLADNMRHAGLLQPGLVDAHFERAIDHLIMLAHIFRVGPIDSRERFVVEDSISLLRQAYDGGRGVITITPHLIGFPVYGPVITPHVPCTLYVRLNKDPRKMAINHAIARDAGCELAVTRRHASEMEKLQVAINVLRQGQQLFITPDTPRKPHQGIPVNILGHTAYFPTGPFVMALRTGAPVVPVWWRWDPADGKYHMWFDQPIELARGRGAPGLREQTESATRKWAADIDAYLRAHPTMWWNWLDKRWTRILHSSPVAGDAT
ncbi:MAG: hypothetical protein BIFFINMI_00754 [Phycisphaerae bacterium]|nr:hypothetical protein [Phycisphaerae bacterium]